jgi:hypothetical protein
MSVVMSALPPIADIRQGNRDVRFVPEASVSELTRRTLPRWRTPGAATVEPGHRACTSRQPPVLRRTRAGVLLKSNR